MKLTQNTTHQRVSTILLDSKELAKMIAWAAAAGLERHERPNLDKEDVTYAVRFEDETEGSPPYKTGTKAIIQITEDLRPQTAPAT